MKTLKESYAGAIQLKQKQLLSEVAVAELIVEAMDEEDLNKVSDIVAKLVKIKNPQLPNLTKAIEAAEAELNKYTAGGPITKAWTKMKGLVGIDNPVVKISTFADALEKGFSQIPQILKNNGVDLKNADLSKSLATTIAGQKVKTGQKSDEEMSKSATGTDVPAEKLDIPGMSTESVHLTEADSAEQKLKNIVMQLRKALSPSGIFGAFKKVPYINSDALALELTKAPLKVFADVAKAVTSGTKVSEIAPDLKGMVGAKGSVETKGTAEPVPAQPSAQTKQTTGTTQPVASSGSVEAGQTPAEPRGGGTSDAQARARAAVDTLKKMGMNQKAAAKAIKALADAGHLK